jgi:hypothetical protein
MVVYYLREDKFIGNHGNLLVKGPAGWTRTDLIPLGHGSVRTAF